jgi:mannose-P-dolichol utilization defect protein 1
MLDRLNSPIAVVSQTAGCLARLFTTAAEGGDNIAPAGFALAPLLNTSADVVALGKEGMEEGNLGKTRLATVTEKDKQFNVVVTPQSPLPCSSTPTDRKWARKVD